MKAAHKIGSALLSMVMLCVFTLTFSVNSGISYAKADSITTIDLGTFDVGASYTGTIDEGTIDLDTYSSGFVGSTYQYFYDQLDSDQKAVYGNLKKSLTPSVSSVSTVFSKELDETTACSIAVNAVDALMKDYPNIFWFMSYNLSLVSEGSTYQLVIEPETESVYDSSCQDDLTSAVSSVSISGDTRYDKLKSIHDYLANKCTYDDNSVSSDGTTINNPKAFTAYGALIDGLCVCEGYSEAFKLLCDRLSIPCVLQVGTSYGVNHMWNLVQMEDGNWYAVDVTWDDQETIILSEFFLVGSSTVDTHFYQEAFTKSHVISGYFSEYSFSKSFTYPTMSKSAYQAEGTTSETTSDTTVASNVTFTKPSAVTTTTTTIVISATTAVPVAVVAEATTALYEESEATTVTTAATVAVANTGSEETVAAGDTTTDTTTAATTTVTASQTGEVTTVSTLQDVDAETTDSFPIGTVILIIGIVFVLAGGGIAVVLITKKV